MPKRILLIDGHPDASGERFCHALAKSYAEGAEQAGHQIRRIAVHDLGLEPLRSREVWEKGTPDLIVARCQEDIGWADHLFIVYPLWLGDMPALLKAFFEQVFRPGFAIAQDRASLSPGLLKGKSARVVVTMGMPAFIYRWYFLAHSLKSLRRNILNFSGIGPVRETVIGNVEGCGPTARAKWLADIAQLGRKGL
jgi:putative NADPH-quinone reductase